MAIYLATKTLDAIEKTVREDQGATFRYYLGQIIPHMKDAYRSDEFPFRGHMGASIIGGECPRQIWYGFHWAKLSKHTGRLLRLFNRGHLEEARFIAMLLTIGVRVYQQDENGNQFTISDSDGHFGGSGDGIGIGIPDIPESTECLLEFKTAAEKSFLSLEKNGVREDKFEHYVQMQIYMRKMGLAVALYLVVNKNNDKLYGEIVPFDGEVADQFLDRGNKLINMKEPPKKISESPGWYKCKWCDFNRICHYKEQPHQNCRTCKFSSTGKNGEWLCGNLKSNERNPLSKETQLKGCDQYERSF